MTWHLHIYPLTSPQVESHHLKTKSKNKNHALAHFHIHSNTFLVSIWTSRFTSSRTSRFSLSQNLLGSQHQSWKLLGSHNNKLIGPSPQTYSTNLKKNPIWLRIWGFQDIFEFSNGRYMQCYCRYGTFWFGFLHRKFDTHQRNTITCCSEQLVDEPIVSFFPEQQQHTCFEISKTLHCIDKLARIQPDDGLPTAHFAKFTYT